MQIFFFIYLTNCYWEPTVSWALSTVGIPMSLCLQGTFNIGCICWHAILYFAFPTILIYYEISLISLNILLLTLNLVECEYCGVSRVVNNLEKAVYIDELK